MIRKLTLAVGLGAGYVLGTKAGRQRYEQIVGKVRSFAGRPAVQDAKGNLIDTAGVLGDKAKSSVNQAMSTLTHKATDRTDGMLVNDIIAT